MNEPIKQLSIADITLVGIICGKISPATIPDYQWPLVITRAIAHNLGPMLLWVIKEDGFSDPFVDARFTSLAALAKKSAVNFAMLSATQTQVESALREAGIPAIWIKGIVLAQTIYPKPFLRPMSDLDLLIPDNQRQAALEALLALGFLEHNINNRFTQPAMPDKHYHLMGGKGGAVHLELHHYLIDHDENNPNPIKQMEWFWGQTQTAKLGDRNFLVFRPEVHLLYLCAHAILQHPEAYPRLFWFYDIHLMVTKGALNWKFLVESAIHNKWTYAVERTLLLSELWFGTPLPEGILEELRSGRSTGEDLDQANKGADATYLLGKLITNPATYLQQGGFRNVINHLFPSPGFMRAKYEVPSGAPIIPYYFYRYYKACRALGRLVYQRLTASKRR